MKCLLIYNPYLTSSISPPFINPNVIYSTCICTNFSRVNSNRTAAPLVTSDLTGLSHRIRFHPSLIRLSLCKNRLATERGCATKNHRKEGYSRLKKNKHGSTWTMKIPKNIRTLSKLVFGMMGMIWYDFCICPNHPISICGYGGPNPITCSANGTIVASHQPRNPDTWVSHPCPTTNEKHYLVVHPS